MLTTRVHIGLSKLRQMLLARRSSTNHFELSHRSAFLHQIFRTLRKVTFGLVARPRKAVYECHPDFSFTFMICKSCNSLLSSSKARKTDMRTRRWDNWVCWRIWRLNFYRKRKRWSWDRIVTELWFFVFDSRLFQLVLRQVLKFACPMWYPQYSPVVGLALEGKGSVIPR